MDQQGKYARLTYYDKVGPSIKLDLRWLHELGPEELAVFDSIAGKVNEPYAYEIPDETSTAEERR